MIMKQQVYWIHTNEIIEAWQYLHELVLHIDCKVGLVELHKVYYRKNNMNKCEFCGNDMAEEE